MSAVKPVFVRAGVRVPGHRPARHLALPFALAIAFATFFSGSEVRASCDVIPVLNDFQRAALGSITRPALIPGFPAEVFVNPAVCNQQARSAAPDFRAVNSPAGCNNDTVLCNSLAASKFQVNLVFTPDAGVRNVVVLRQDCSTLDLGTCSLPASQIHCLDPTTSPPAEFAIREVSLSGGLTQRRLEFTFPDTTDLVDGSVSFSGNATVAVTLASDPVPCALASSSCDSVGGLVTCADWLFQRDGTCDTVPAVVDPVAVHVTALPVPNVFTEICPLSDSSGLCVAPPGVAPTIRLTRDAAGNFLVPMDYRDVLVRVLGEPFPRTLRGALEVAGQAVAPESDDFVESRGTTFGPVLPIFEPLTDPSQAGRFFGAVDAGFIIHRIFAHACAEDPAIPCSVDSECVTTCSVDKYAGLAAVASAAGAGPILGECPLVAGESVCSVGETVTIDTLTTVGTDDRAVPAPVNECVAQLVEPPRPSANDDPDTRDVVMRLFDRQGFGVKPIGDNGAAGRAATRIIDQPPFSFATHDAEGDVIAFLESELAECDFAAPADCDANGNGLPFDHILNVLQVDAAGGAPHDLLANPVIVGDDLGRATPGGYKLAVEPDMNVNRTPVAVSDGLVFFLVRAAANAPRSVELANTAADGAPGSDAAADVDISADGRFVAFASVAKDLVKDTNREYDVFVKDLETLAVTRVSVQDRVDCEGNIHQAKGGSFGPSVSTGGRHVAFWSAASNLLNPPKGKRFDQNGLADVFVHDVVTCSTKRVSVGVGPAGEIIEGTGPSLNPSISGDGRFIVFESAADNLDPSDTHPGVDVFLHDRDADGNGIFDENPAVVPNAISTVVLSAGGNGASAEAEISLDGVEVVFQSDSAFAAGDDNASSDVYVDDAMGGLARASVATDGTQADAGSFKPSISADGRFVVFESDAATLVVGDDNGRPDIFVHDRESGVTRRVGLVASARECALTGDDEPDGTSRDVQISADGRFLVYRSTSGDLVPGDGNAFEDVFIEDLRTGAIARLSQSASGVGADADSGPPRVALAGSAVAFASEAGNLGPAGDPRNPGSNVFVSRAGGAGPAGAPAGARLGVLDTRVDPPRLTILADLAEHVAVANGAAAFVAPGQNVKLFRYACGGAPGGPACDGVCPCAPVVEDLLRPGVSTSDSISISDQYVCAVVADGPAGVLVPACHEIGTSPGASLDDVAPPGVEADTIQVSGAGVVFTSPQGGDRILYDIDLSAPAPAARSLQSVRDVVLGDIACFTTAESDLGSFPGCDENGDGDCGDFIMFAAEPGDTNPPASCEASAVPCLLSSCDPRQPHSVVVPRTCKFVTDTELEVADCIAAGRDVNRDGNCSFLVQRCTLGTDTSNVVVGDGNVIAPEARENPVEAQIGGDVDLAPACVEPTDLDQPLGFCPCPAGEVCSDTLAPPRLFAALRADPDGDGILDETCTTRSNADPVDFDGDGIDDACDGFVCGDGILQRAEACDPGIDPLFCTAPDDPQGGCLPVVVYDVSESAVNPDQQGNLPGYLSSPTREIDPASLRFAAVVDGDCRVDACVGGTADGAACSSDAECPGGGLCAGVPLANDPSQNDQDGDGVPDLLVHFPVPGSGISITTTEVCVQGTFVDGEFSFEARDVVNVK
jgi:Tol biopolymer transport system component